MTFVATGKCPACPWKVNQIIETHGTVKQQIEIANSVIDPIISEHIKHHQAIRNMLIEAGEAPLLPGMKATNSFRGLFSIQYKEVKD